MQKILMKRVVRDLKKHLFRYIALFFLIVLGLYMVVSMAGGADIVQSTVYDYADKNQLEDGQFSVFVPLTDDEIDELKVDGTIIQADFNMEYTMDDDSTLRIYSNREEINKINIDNGELPQNDNEIVVEKKYAESHQIKVGSDLAVGTVKMNVVGIGSVPDYDNVLYSMADATSQSENFGVAFVSKRQYEELEKLEENAKTENYEYSYICGNDQTDEDIKDILKEMKSNLISFTKKSDNPRIFASVNDVMIMKYAGLAAGILILAIFTYIISVFVIHNIEMEATIIGSLYSMGVGRGTLLGHYLMLPVLLSFVAGLCGTALGFSGIGAIRMGESNSVNYSIPELIQIYPIYLLIYGIVLPPIIALIVNYLVINKKLSEPVLALLRNEKKNPKIIKINVKSKNFITHFQIRLFLREFRVCVTLLIGLLLSILILTLGVDCYNCCSNMKIDNAEDVKFGYMYLYKYPSAETPKGGTDCYVETLKKEIFGFDFDVQVMGIDNDNPYFDFEVSEGKNVLAVSNSTAEKFNLKVGDEIVLNDNFEDQSYGFKVEKIVDYSVGLYVFMDIDSMRELFGKDDDYYNVVLSDEELDIESSRIYNVTTREDILGNAEVFMEIMQQMIFMLIGISAAIFVIIMYLLLKVIIERSSQNISMFKILGFSDKEIKRMFLNGNLYVVAFGSVICIFVCKLLVDKIYPACFVSNVACGMNYSCKWYIYVAMYLGIIICYLLTNFVLVRKLKKIPMNEVLKNRE